MEYNGKPLVIIAGPTATGKSELAIKLAGIINGEIISADSIQVYKYMDIGSAKVLQKDRKDIKHYLIDVLEPTEDFNVFFFKKQVDEALKEIYSKGKIPILVGGTGFYIQSVLYDIDFGDDFEDLSYRDYLYELSEKDDGTDRLYDELKLIDPESAENIHKNNVKKVIRALCFYHDTGKKMSSHNDEERAKESPYNYAYFVLNDEREKLYENINKRVDLMIEKGLINEVEMLLNMGCKEGSVSMQGLGYKEIVSFLKGDCTLEEAIYEIKKLTRHFCKKQLTWFKRERDVNWINKNEFNYNTDFIVENILNILKDKSII